MTSVELVKVSPSLSLSLSLSLNGMTAAGQVSRPPVLPPSVRCIYPGIEIAICPAEQ